MDGAKRRVVDSRCNDVKAIDQIMLRFRPIVPKPVNGESSGGVARTMDGILKRVKRKYVKVKKKNENNKATNISINDNERWLDLDRMNGANTDPLEKVSNWISFGGNAEKQLSDLHGVVESWITMEYVSGMCEDRRLLGYTDEEIWKKLDTDSCPGFVSNGYDEVVWVNPAYRRMLDLDGGGEVGMTEVAVCLVVKVEKSIVSKYLPALSCRVRIEYRLDEKKTQMVVPCDVCKMDSGEFAWRLDVKAALSLGPLNQK